ncbi:MAG: JAB domain-containing protein [Limisphaerales bacterium]
MNCAPSAASERPRAAAIKSAFLLASRLTREALGEAPLIDTPERIADLLREEHRLSTVEYFHVLCLNTRRRLIVDHRIAQGTLDTVLIHPREVFGPAIAAKAAAVAFAHNHPSGVIPHPVLYRTDRASP